MIAKTAQRCYRCGGALTDQNSWTMPASFMSKRVPYCVACQQRFYSWISSLIGWEEAIFICCASFNVPFMPEALREAQLHKEGRGPWGGYLNVMRQRYSWGANNGRASFEHGVRDFRAIFNDEEEADKSEKETERPPREFWGEGPANNPYSESEIEEMERQYAALTEGRYEISEQTKLAILNICQMEVLKNRYLVAGKIKEAKDIAAMIKTEKEGEQLRKKDEMNANTARLDDIVLAVQRAGLDIMDPEELLTALANHSYHPVPSYGYTYDAAEKMLLFIRNATAWNEGREEVDSLPPEYSFAEDVNREFAPTQTEKEKKIYKDLGLFYNGPYEKDPKDKQEESSPKNQTYKKVKKKKYRDVQELVDMPDEDGDDPFGIDPAEYGEPEETAEGENAETGIRDGTGAP